MKPLKPRDLSEITLLQSATLEDTRDVSPLVRALIYEGLYDHVTSKVVLDRAIRKKLADEDTRVNTDKREGHIDIHGLLNSWTRLYAHRIVPLHEGAKNRGPQDEKEAELGKALGEKRAARLIEMATKVADAAIIESLENFGLKKLADRLAGKGK